MASVGETVWQELAGQLVICRTLVWCCRGAALASAVDARECWEFGRPVCRVTASIGPSALYPSRCPLEQLRTGSWRSVKHSLQREGVKHRFGKFDLHNEQQQVGGAMGSPQVQIVGVAVASKVCWVGWFTWACGGRQVRQGIERAVQGPFVAEV